MSRLSKADAKAHQEACALVDLERPLTDDEREFVLDNWQESSTARLDGAFFTPAALAADFSTHLAGEVYRIIDLCAGIGRLAWHCRDEWNRVDWQGIAPREFVCVERNLEYVRVGRKILPDATWICADVLDVPTMGLGRFDFAISNPPFGRISRSGNSPTYTGPLMEYHVISVAAQLAEVGAFIVPQLSAPFRYSGVHQSSWEHGPEYERFVRESGIELGFNMGINTALPHYGGWRGAAPRVEIVVADFKHPEETAYYDESTAPADAAGGSEPAVQDALFA